MDPEIVARRLFAAASRSILNEDNLIEALDNAREKVMSELGETDLVIGHCTESKNREYIVTVKLSRTKETICYEDIDTVGTLWLPGNRSAVVTRRQIPGKIRQCQYEKFFSNEKKEFENDTSGTFPFSLEEMEKLDTAFQYLLARAMLGSDAQLMRVSELPYSISAEKYAELSGGIATNERVFAELHRRHKD